MTQTINTNLIGYGSYSWEIPDDVHTGKCRIVASDGATTITKHFFIYRRLTGDIPGESDYDYNVLYGDQFANFNETDIENYAADNRTSILDTYLEEVTNWHFPSPKDIDPDVFLDIYVGDFNNGYAYPTATGFRYIAMGYPYKDLLKSTYGYSTDLDAIGKVFCHEFLHAIQFHYRNVTDNGWNYVLEGQARFIQTVYLNYHSSSGNEEYKGGRQYQGQANSYLGSNLNTSLSSVSYDYCLFWRFLYENYQSGSELAKLKIFRDFLQESENVGTNPVADGETAFDNALSAGGGAYSSYDDALKDFSKRAYLNDPTYNLWNPVPTAAFYRIPLITDDPDGNGVTEIVSKEEKSNTDNIPVSFGIDYLVYDLDAAVDFVSVKFDGNPDDDSDFADFYVNVLKMNGSTLNSEEEITLVDGKGNISLEANNPINKLVVVVVRLDADEGSKENNYKVTVTPGVEVAFIIDDTGSMSEEIAGVRQALLAHLATYDPNSGTVFQLTTFKDNFTVREPTTDLALIQSQVAALFASGGGDCPEASVEAINAVIDGIKDNGRAFLATDASPHAGLDIEGSIAALRAKGIRVDVVLSGDCYSYSSSPLASGQSVNQGGTGNVPTEVLKHTDQQTTPPTEAIFTAIEAFSLMAQETGGIFAFIPEVNFGSASAVQRFQNTIFNITQGGITQSLAYIQPYTGPAGGSVRITIVGASTNFRSNTALAVEGDGVSVGNITVISPSRLEATVTIDPTAALGFRNLTATTNLGGGVIETATGVGAFEIVNAPATPTIIGINPPLAELGQTLNVTVNGINTNFTNSSVLNLGAGITVNSVNAASSTQLTAEITVSAVTTVGFRSVTVITGGEVATENVTGPFFVAPVTTPLPELISVSPASGAPGTNLNLTISGANTAFVNNISSVGFSGSGIDVLGVNVISPTLLTASIHLADDAEPGYRDVRVTTSLEVAVLLDGFLVTEDVTPTYPYLFLSNTDVEISRV
ncbi:MAG: hypothetical protein KDK34_00250, partial [Leptospiraceae bacterium]|nr:hypothetical protein [Leptospiraceae bacterium]